MLFFLLPCGMNDVGLSIDLFLDLGIENVLLDLPFRNPNIQLFPVLCGSASPASLVFLVTFSFCNSLWYVPAF